MQAKDDPSHGFLDVSQKAKMESSKMNGKEFEMRKGSEVMPGPRIISDPPQRCD